MATSIRPTSPQSAQRITAASQAQVSARPQAPARPAPAPLSLERAKVAEWSGATRWPKVGGLDVVTTPASRMVEVALAGGGKGTVDWSDESLALKHPKTGATVVLERTSPRVATELAALLEDETADSGVTAYDSSRSFSPVGAAGQLLSAREVVSSYTGGAHPNNGTRVRTYDARTGKQLKLDQLLTPEQFQKVVAGVKQGLDKLEDVDSFRPDNLSKAVRENFALVTDSRGKVHIEVLLPSYVHAMGGLEAQFRFAAPDDAAFRGRAGL